MLRTLITAATASLLLAAAPATRAEKPFVCSLIDANGNSIIYGFDARDRNVMVELVIERNGNRLEHAPGSRPRWAVEPTPDGNWLLRYLPDPRFMLGIDSKPRYVPAGKGFPAVLYASGDTTARARGACALPRDLRNDYPFE